MLRRAFCTIAGLLVLGANRLAAQNSAPLKASAPPARSASEVVPPGAVTADAGRSPASVSPGGSHLQQARVTWDGRALQVEASNSSLAQILRTIASLTGAKLQGPINDQQIFGTYGPGPACDVVSRLLKGSGQNVVMLGSPDTGAPLVILLSERLALPPTPAKAASQTGSAEQDDAQPQPTPQPSPSSDVAHAAPQPNPFNNGGPTRDPVQFMDEVLHRQQAIDEQQDKAKEAQQP